MKKSKMIFRLLSMLAISFTTGDASTAAFCKESSKPLGYAIATHDLEIQAQARKIEFAGACTARITDISTHKHIFKAVEESARMFGPENIWIVYDIDDCLTYPDHAGSLPYSYAGQYKKLFIELCEKHHLTPVEKSLVWNLKYTVPESLLTEADLPDFFEKLKALGVKVYGLTASMAGAVKHDFHSNHHDRVGVLKDLGLTFSGPHETCVLTQFTPFHKSYPIYHDGVAFAQKSQNYGSATKGEIIMAMIDTFHDKPQIVFMIDDSPTNLHQVDYVLQQHDIDCRTYKYRSDRVHEAREIAEFEYIKHIEELIAIAKESTKKHHIKTD